MNESRKLTQLKAENSRFIQIIADLTLDKQMLQDVQEKPLKVHRLHVLTIKLIVAYLVSIRRMCKVVSLHRLTRHYKHHRREDRPLRQRIKEIAAIRLRYGLWRIYILLRREGFKDNYKRMYRIYKEEVLNLRSKPFLSYHQHWQSCGCCCRQQKAHKGTKENTSYPVV